MSAPTKTDVRRLFDYNQETGVVLRLTQSSTCVSVGDVVGGTSRSGYMEVQIEGKHYKLHRIIWLHVHGEWPAFIDHINGDPSDNRLCNLRSVSHQANDRNRKTYKNNTSGFRGVRWDKSLNKWRASIGAGVKGRKKYLGCFIIKEDAISARKAAEIEHNYHPNHGRAS